MAFTIGVNGKTHSVDVDDDTAMFVVDREVVQAPDDAGEWNSISNDHRLPAGRGLLSRYLASWHSNQYQPTQQSGSHR